MNDKEKEELIELAQSQSLREDMETLRARSRDYFIVNGEVDADRWIEFLTAYNEFINHAPKPFKPIIDKVMKL